MSRSMHQATAELLIDTVLLDGEVPHEDNWPAFCRWAEQRDERAKDAERLEADLSAARAHIAKLEQDLLGKAA